MHENIYFWISSADSQSTWKVKETIISKLYLDDKGILEI